METVENTEQKPALAVPPKTWLAESILVTIFCCWPFGIPGIVYATKVESLFYAGRIEEAERASRDAGKWTKISLWVGLGSAVLIGIFYGILFAFGFAAGAFGNLFQAI